MNSQEIPSDSETTILSNSYITCYSDHLVIHWYYFPFGSKTIKYNFIHSCDLLALEDLSFAAKKLWGMSLSPIWWPADFYRYSRKYYLLLSTNSWPKIGLTMDDNDIQLVYTLIEKNIETK